MTRQYFIFYIELLLEKSLTIRLWPSDWHNIHQRFIWSTHRHLKAVFTLVAFCPVLGSTYLQTSIQSQYSTVKSENLINHWTRLSTWIARDSKNPRTFRSTPANDRQDIISNANLRPIRRLQCSTTLKPRLIQQHHWLQAQDCHCDWMQSGIFRVKS